MIKINNNKLYIQRVKATNNYRLAQVFAVLDGEIEDITLHVAMAADLPLRHECLMIKGHGFNLAQDITESLSEKTGQEYKYKTIEGLNL